MNIVERGGQLPSSCVTQQDKQRTIESSAHSVELSRSEVLERFKTLLQVCSGELPVMLR